MINQNTTADALNQMLAGARQVPSIDASRQPVVEIKAGEVLADSRDVAASFGKNHKDVLRAIRDLVAKEPSLGQRNFAPFKIKDLTGETTSHYLMDRKGFTLLAMGFTGDRALKWKLRYIEAFEVMEAELRRRETAPSVDFSDPKMLLGAFQYLQQQVSEKDEIIAAMAPKVEAHDRIADSFGSVCRRVAAKNLGIPPLVLNRWMRTNGWTYQLRGSDEDIAYQSKIAAGFLEHRIVDLGERPDGTRRTKTQVLVTPKGMLELAKAFPPAVREVK